MAELAKAMKIYYIHQYFRAPKEGGATRSFHLAKGLIDAGHEVEVISGGARVYDFQKVQGIKVHYLPVSYDQKYGFLNRLLSFFLFVFHAKKLLKKLPRPDILYITSTPLTTGWIGLWAKRKFALPYIFEVRDLWPEAPIQVLGLKNSLLKKFLYGQEKRIYQQALQLVALSPGIANYLREVVPSKKVSLIPNFSDPKIFHPIKKEKNILEQYGLRDALTIAYTGALGKVNAVNELLDLAEMAKAKGKNWQFLIMGEGAEKVALMNQAKVKQLTQVKFFPFGSKYQVNEVLSVADLAWISFAHFPVLKTNSPNKFFDALAAGKGILVNHKGWVYRLMMENQLGFSAIPGSLPVLLSQLEGLELKPKELRKIQANSLALSQQFFTKEIAIYRLLHVFDPEEYPLIQDHEAYTRIA